MPITCALHTYVITPISMCLAKCFILGFTLLYHTNNVNISWFTFLQGIWWTSVDKARERYGSLFRGFYNF